MLLIISHSTDETANYLSTRLTEEGIALGRLDSDRIEEHAYVRHAHGRTTLVLDDAPLQPDEIAAVWLRRPERLRLTDGPDEGTNNHAVAEWSAALEGFLHQITFERWVNHPGANAGASYKLEQLCRARRLGLAVPETLVTHDPAEAHDFWTKHGGEVIAKPLSAGQIARASGDYGIIYTSAVTRGDLRDLGLISRCPTLFQERLRKQTDVRVTVVDEEATAIAIQHLDEVGAQLLDVRRENMIHATYEEIAMPPPVHSSLLALIRSYQLRFAAVDFVITDSGAWMFLEVNPNGQWAWMDLFGGCHLYQLFLPAFRGAS